MNLRSFINAECANYHDGHCAGLTALNERFRPEGECCALNGERCEYFDTVLIPLLEYPDPTGMNGLRRNQGQAVAIYQRQVEEVTTGGNTCNGCGCPIPARKRFCSSCRDSQRKKTMKRSKRASRKNADQNRAGG